MTTFVRSRQSRTRYNQKREDSLIFRAVVLPIHARSHAHNHGRQTVREEVQKGDVGGGRLENLHEDQGSDSSAELPGN